jgi:sulfite exporter TauE/SafE
MFTVDGPLAAWCGPQGLHDILQYGSLIGLLAGGAAGSPIHCTPMCGPFVLGQVADQIARIPAAQLCEARRIANGALPGYHTGRLITYALLGAGAGAAGQALRGYPWLDTLAGTLLLFAALLFAAQASRRFLPWKGRGVGSTHPWFVLLARFISRFGQLARGKSLLVGLALGLLPCGFLYAALAVAAASLSPWRGAVDMVAFGLGTMPALIAVGIAGQAGGRAWHRAITQFAPLVLGLNAIVLAGLGLGKLGL